MPRQSLVHYIAPSAISLIPNCNGSANDIAVYLSRETKIKVNSDNAGIGIDAITGSYQEWTLSGRNRRLAESSTPYTIYARLNKTDKTDGYLVFVKQQLDGMVWKDKYPYVIKDGDGLYHDVYGTESQDYWYVRLGEVSLPVSGKREVTLDTGILGTDQYNEEWNLNPDSLPLRIDLSATVDDEDAGPTPYVYWGKTLQLTASLIKGWSEIESGRLDHWEIARNSGNAAADAQWPGSERAQQFAGTGIINLSHSRSSDDFNGAVNATFTVTAWGYPDTDSSGTPPLQVLESASICIMAETLENLDFAMSSAAVNYNPKTDAYSPTDGVNIYVRATDQRGDAFNVTVGQYTTMGLAMSYAAIGTDEWTAIPVTGQPSAAAIGNVPVSAFAVKKNINVRLTRSTGGGGTEELYRNTIAFVSDGETGPSGGNTATVMLYKRSSSAITTVGISTKLYYKFSTRKLYSDAACTTEATAAQLNNWSMTIPNTSTNQIYVTAAIAYSNTASDDIATTEWVTPAQFTENGEQGAHGVNTATIFLYKRSATAISAHGITTTLYYKFSDGKLYTKSGSTYTEATDANLNSWKREIPTGNGNPCYLIQVAALATDDYDQIATTDWSGVRKLVEDGTSITKSSETYRYATNNTGVRPAASSQDWSTTKPTLQKGYWLYTETTITWSDNSKTVLYTDERNPNDGAAGMDIVAGTTTMTYAITQTNQQPADSAFGAYPSILTQGWYLWSRAETPYYKDHVGGTSAGNSVVYNVSYIAVGTSNNLLYQTQFLSGQMNKWYATNGTIVANAFDGHNGFYITASSSLGQYVQGTGYEILMPSTIYTISFWSKGHIAIDINPGDTGQAYAPFDRDWGRWIDGVKVNGPINDFYYQFTNTDWTHHTITFKTASAFDGSLTSLYWHAPNANNRPYICMPKLERGESATAYSTNDEDLNGRAITSVTEYYKASANATGEVAPSDDSGWSTDPNTAMANWNQTNKYLWNYEKVTYSKAPLVERTTPAVLAIWTKDGAAGKGIDSITNYYKVTSSSTAPSKPSTPGTGGWSTTPTAPGAGEYLWNYEVITWVNPSGTTETAVQLIGHSGIDGTNAKYITVKGSCLQSSGSTPNANVIVSNGSSTLINNQGNCTADTVTGSRRGLALFTVKKSDMTLGTKQFYDTWSDTARADALATAIDGITSDYIICLVSYDAVGWSTNLIAALKSCGSRGVENQTTGRYPFAFIGCKGLPEGYAFQMQGTLQQTTTVDLTAYVAEGTLVTTPSGKDGIAGNNGNDAVVIEVTPSSLIVNQNLNNPSNLSNLTEYITFSAMKGSTQLTVTKVEITSTNHCAVSGGNVAYATVTAINTYTQSGKTYYYDTAEFIAKITYNDGGTSKTVTGIRCRIYANLLSEWKQTIEAGEETIAVQKVSYAINNGDTTKTIEQSKTEFNSVRNSAGQFASWQSQSASVDGSYQNMTSNINTLKDTATEHTQRMQRMTGSNRVPGADTYTPATTMEKAQYITSGDWVYSVYIPNGVSATDMSVIRFYDSEDSTTVVASKAVTLNSDTDSANTVDGYTRHYITFNTSEFTTLTDVYFRAYLYTGHKFPQLEPGTVPTPFNVGRTTTESQIKQTADKIDLSITNKLGETGIHINGANRTIELNAENTTIDNRLKVGSLQTTGNEGSVLIQNGIALFSGLNGVVNIRMGIDSQGCAMFKFYDNNGNYVYGLGPNDLPQSMGNMASHFRTLFGMQIYNLAVEYSRSNMRSLAATADGGNLYVFEEGYTYVSNVKRYNASGSATPSLYNNKTYDSNLQSSQLTSWYPAGNEIDAGYYISNALHNENYIGLETCYYQRSVYKVDNAGDIPYYIGDMYYKYDANSNEAQLTNYNATSLIEYDISRTIISYIAPSPIA